MLENQDKNFEIDNTDLKILDILIRDANTPYTEVAKQVFVSDGTVHGRMKKMRDMGIIKGSQLLVDYTKLGWDITAFIGIYLDKSSLYEDVIEQLKNIPEVVTMNYMTGSYSIFAKLVCKNTKHLLEVLHDQIQNVSGIQRTETFISLDESVNRNVPILKK
jgi:Lrp/AsnC family transcriptional regulator for asnA, asnC and gidA